MKRRLSDLSDQEHDLVIVGGGAFGACAAWEAASRGLSVALIEKDDFCQATSANHGKFVHGGIRYLQHLDFRRVRESCRERSALLRIAPHLVQPLPIIMPTYGRGLEGQSILRAGLALYDLVVHDRNSGIPDPDRQIPRGRIIDRDSYLKLFPDLGSKGLTGAGLFYDAQFYNPPRLVLAFLKSAIHSGAHVANYVAATGLICNGNRASGVVARDKLSGDEFEVRGRLILNAAGPWASDFLVRALKVEIKPKPRFSRDAGFIIRGRRTGNYAFACRLETKDPDAVLSRKGRHVFLAPWRDFTWVGSWHVVHTKETDDVAVGFDELTTFVQEVNTSYPELGLCLDDVTMILSGLTLFGDNKPGQKDLRFAHRSRLIDHKEEHGIDGLVTLIGVRATMARGMAENTINLVLRKLGCHSRPSSTDHMPLHGGSIDRFEDFFREALCRHSQTYSAEVIRNLVHNYGTEYTEILRLAEGDQTMAKELGKSNTLKAQVVYAIRDEMAQSLSDVVFGRTDLGTGGHPGPAAIDQCAQIMGNEFGWDKDRQKREIEEVLERFPSIQDFTE